MSHINVRLQQNMVCVWGGGSVRVWVGVDGLCVGGCGGVGVGVRLCKIYIYIKQLVSTIYERTAVNIFSLSARLRVSSPKRSVCKLTVEISDTPFEIGCF